MWQLINLITHLKPDNLQERFPLKQWNSGRFSSLLPGQISCGFSFKYVNNCPVLICRAFNWWLSEEWCHILSSNGWCGSLCFCGRQYSGVFILSSASSQPATGKQAPQPWMKQEVWQLESAVGPLVFSRSMSWPRSPEMQTHTHRAPIVAAFSSPLILIWNAAGNPWFPDTRQAAGSKGKLH